VNSRGAGLIGPAHPRTLRKLNLASISGKSMLGTMTKLADSALERLCDLFASGNIALAVAIAQLVVQEINEPPPRPEALFNSDLLRRAALALQKQ